METWICDSCGGLIESADDGWVEWVAPVGAMGRGLRLVHHTVRGSLSKCMYNQQAEYAKDKGVIGDLQLSEFLGADGLMTLLEFISDKKLPTEEVLELIKRLHIPGYEHARHTFDEAIDEGVFEPNTAPKYYMQSDIQATLDYIAKKSG